MVQSHRVPKIPTKNLKVFIEELRAKLQTAPAVDRESIFSTDYNKMGQDFTIVVEREQMEPNATAASLLQALCDEFGLRGLGPKKTGKGMFG